MSTEDDDISLIQTMESSTTKTMHHFEWAKVYYRVAAVHEERGLTLDATEARWMAHLLEMATVPKPARTGNKEGWFAPLVTYTNGSTSPGPDIFTDDMLDYCEQKMDGLANPFLRARCCDIIWEKRGKHRCARGSISAHKEAIHVLRRCNGWPKLYVHLARAIELSRLLNDASAIFNARRMWLAYVGQLLLQREHGFAGRVMDLENLFGSSLSCRQRSKLAGQCETIAEDYRNRNDLQAERRWLSRANQLHTRAGDTNQAQTCHVREVESMLSEGKWHLEQGSGLLAVHWLQEARVALDQLGGVHRERAEGVALLLRGAHDKAKTEMGSVESKVECPMEFVDKVNALRQLRLRDGLRGIFCNQAFLPCIGEIRQRAAESATNAPFYHLAHRTISDGRNVIARSDDASHDDHIFLEHMGWEMQVKSQFLARSVWTVLEGRRASARSFRQLVECPLIAPSARPLIYAGLERYLKWDFASAMHILLPQFEACIRHALFALGRPTSRLRRKQRSTSEEKPLDEMLRDDVLQETLGEDLCCFYRFVFSDQRGWNLRNVVCHGLTGGGVCGEPLISTVVYALLSLGWFGVTERGGEKPSET